MADFELTPEIIQRYTQHDIRTEGDIPEWRSSAAIPIGALSLHEVVEAAERFKIDITGMTKEVSLKQSEGQNNHIEPDEVVDKMYPTPVVEAIRRVCDELSPLVEPLTTALNFRNGLLVFENEGRDGSGSNVVPHLDDPKSLEETDISVICAYPRNTQIVRPDVPIKGQFPEEVVSKNGDLLTVHYDTLTDDSWVSFEGQAILIGEATTLHKKPPFKPVQPVDPESVSYRALLRLNFRSRSEV